MKEMVKEAAVMKEGTLFLKFSYFFQCGSCALPREEEGEEEEEEEEGVMREMMKPAPVMKEVMKEMMKEAAVMKEGLQF